MLCEIGDCDFDDENDAALTLHGFTTQRKSSTCAQVDYENTNSILNVMFSTVASKNILRLKRNMSTTSSPFTQAVITAMRKL